MGRFKKKKQNIKGASLFLAMLILAAVLAIAFGISSLLLREIKLSKDVVSSLKAYYAAEAGIERKLYEIRKNNNFNDIAFPCSVELSNGSSYGVDVTTGNPTRIKAYGCYKNTRRAVEISY